MLIERDRPVNNPSFVFYVAGIAPNILKAKFSGNAVLLRVEHVKCVSMFMCVGANGYQFLRR